MTIREAIEVMKILAPAVPILKDEPTAPAFVRALMAHFRETDPTNILRLISLLYHEPMESLIEALDPKDGFATFQMITYGFAMNSVADLIEALKMLGFYKEVKHG